MWHNLQKVINQLRKSFVAHAQCISRLFYTGGIGAGFQKIYYWSLLLIVKGIRFMGWFNSIINNLLLFSFLEEGTIRTHIEHDLISLTTFMRYLPWLLQCVEEKVSRLLPTKFSLDGFSEGCTHYLAMFASHSISNVAGYIVRCLFISSLGNGFSSKADEHVSFTTYVLGVCKCSWDVTALIGDNCATNRSIANEAGQLLIGCASTRFCGSMMCRNLPKEAWTEQ